MRLMFEEVRHNKFLSWMLVLVFILLIILLGSSLGYYYNNLMVGCLLSLVAAGIYTLISYFSGDRMILTMSGAKEVTKKEFPHLVHAVEGLSIAAGLPVPKTFVIDDTALNAFATGRDPEHAAITVTTGLMAKLNRQELEGVIAHEMSHIKNYDIRMMMLVTVLIGVVMLLSDFLLRSFLWGGRGRRRSSDSSGQGNITIVFIILGLVLAILSPIAAQMIRLAISRKREYAADANAAVLTRYPPGLAGALKKISADPDPLVDRANKATAHLFISSPFKQKGSLISGLLATHPPIEDRIKRLEEM